VPRPARRLGYDSKRGSALAARLRARARTRRRRNGKLRGVVSGARGRDAGSGAAATGRGARAGRRAELTRNEIEQVGFRLARERGHKTVYPVDAEGEFPYQRKLAELVN